jgi:restriction system protein
MSAEEAGPRLALMSAVALAGGILFLVVPLFWNSPFAVVFTNSRQAGFIMLGFGAAFGVAAYLVGRHVQAKSARFQRTGVTVKELRSLSPAEFEEWCAARLREQGYSVTVVGGRGDHGVDLIAEREGSRMVVQCKRWYGGRSVGESEIRDLVGAMQHEQAASGMVVTTEQFTPAAVSWAQGKPIKLWNVEQLVAASPAPVADPTVAAMPLTEACPSCGRELVRRVNRSTQAPFWGCSGYPACRFTRPI